MTDKPEIALSTSAVGKAADVLVSEVIDEPRARQIAHKALRAAQPDIAAAAVQVFINRLDAFSKHISGEGHREAMRLAVREFGVDPAWFFDEDRLAAGLAWEAQNPSYYDLDSLKPYDTRPDSSIEAYE